MTTAAVEVPSAALQLDAIVSLLESRRYRYQDEDELQRGITLVLTQGGVAFEREARLTAKERVDFLVGRIGVEVKIKGSVADVARQLLRYAPHVDGLLLVTGRSQLDRLPPTLGGKPVRVLSLLGGLR